MVKLTFHFLQCSGNQNQTTAHSSACYVHSVENFIFTFRPVDSGDVYIAHQWQQHVSSSALALQPHSAYSFYHLGYSIILSYLSYPNVSVVWIYPLVPMCSDKDFLHTVVYTSGILTMTVHGSAPSLTWKKIEVFSATTIGYNVPIKVSDSFRSLLAIYDDSVWELDVW